MDNTVNISNKDQQLKPKKKWWQYIYIIYDWTIFEQILFLVNFVLSISFFIYGFVEWNTISDDKTNAYIINSVSLVANITNIFSIILGAKKKISTFFWGVVACSTLGVTAFLQRATGSWILYWVVQIPLQIVGIFNWRKNSANKIDITPKSMKWWIFLLLGVGLALFVGLFAWLDSLPQFQKIWYPDDYKDLHNWAVYIADAGILVLGVVAMTMMTLRYREQWILWLLLDVCCIILWAINYNIQLLIMSIAALINAIYGLIVWYLQGRKKNVQA
jgi:nicotinamide mononucleotide transporter